MVRISIFGLCLVALAIPPAHGQLRPTQSIIDYLKAKNADHSLEARRALFMAEFPNAPRYVGLLDENATLLRILLRKERNSCCAIGNCIAGTSNSTIILIGGFGWSSRSSAAPPDIWTFTPGKACLLEPSVFGIIDKTITGDWDQSGNLSQLVADHLLSQEKKGPLIIVGHSFGAAGALATASELEQRNIDVDLVVAIDAISPNSPIKGNELSLPKCVKHFVHVAADKETWPLSVAHVSGNTLEYVVSDTTHTDVDSAAETIDIVRYVVSLLPDLGSNSKDPEYFVPPFPKKVEDFPASIRQEWKRKVTVRSAR
jgi:pimeloyl-ACP methyl ester carboxylesterase